MPAHERPPPLLAVLNGAHTDTQTQAHTRTHTRARTHTHTHKPRTLPWTVQTTTGASHTRKAGYRAHTQPLSRFRTRSTCTATPHQRILTAEQVGTVPRSPRPGPRISPGMRLWRIILTFLLFVLRTCLSMAVPSGTAHACTPAQLLTYSHGTNVFLLAIVHHSHNSCMHTRAVTHVQSWNERFSPRYIPSQSQLMHANTTRSGTYTHTHPFTHIADPPTHTHAHARTHSHTHSHYGPFGN